jgi:DNA polymerase III alpha subunit
MFDVDIDFANRDAALQNLHCVAAALTNKHGATSRHPSGVYFQDVPVNPLNQLCAFDYEEAEDRGYFKVDFLNQSVYQAVRDEEHLDELLARTPPWELLDEAGMVEQLPHIHKHFDVVQAIRPKSIIDLAVVLALIRPGKRQLLGRPRAEIDRLIWNTSGIEEGYQFKKAHALSYAALIVVQMNLIVEALLADDDGISI